VRKARLVDLASAPASLLETATMPNQAAPYSVSGDDRVYFPTALVSAANANPVVIVSGLDAEQMTVTSLALPLASKSPGQSPTPLLVPEGERVFLLRGDPDSIRVVDTSNLDGIEIGPPVELSPALRVGFSVVDDVAICSHGLYGVTAVDLPLPP
jgi:hypothetical protein